MGVASTYAVVTFDEEAADRIRSEGPDAIIDLQWRATPAPEDRGGNYIDSFECADEAAGLRGKIEAALAASSPDFSPSPPSDLGWERFCGWLDGGFLAGELVRGVVW